MQLADKRLNFSSRSEQQKLKILRNWFISSNFLFNFSISPIYKSLTAIPTYKRCKRPPSQIFLKFPELSSSNVQPTNPTISPTQLLWLKFQSIFTFLWFFMFFLLFMLFATFCQVFANSHKIFAWISINLNFYDQTIGILCFFPFLIYYIWMN